MKRFVLFLFMFTVSMAVRMDVYDEGAFLYYDATHHFEKFDWDSRNDSGACPFMFEFTENDMHGIMPKFTNMSEPNYSYSYKILDTILHSEPYFWKSIRTHEYVKHGLPSPYYSTIHQYNSDVLSIWKHMYRRIHQTKSLHEAKESEQYSSNLEVICFDDNYVPVSSDSQHDRFNQCLCSKTSFDPLIPMNKYFPNYMSVAYPTAFQFGSTYQNEQRTLNIINSIEQNFESKVTLETVLDIKMKHLTEYGLQCQIGSLTGAKPCVRLELLLSEGRNWQTIRLARNHSARIEIPFMSDTSFDELIEEIMLIFNDKHSDRQTQEGLDNTLNEVLNDTLTKIKDLVSGIEFGDILNDSFTVDPLFFDGRSSNEIAEYNEYYTLEKKDVPLKFADENNVEDGEYTKGDETGPSILMKKVIQFWYTIIGDIKDSKDLNKIFWVLNFLQHGSSVPDTLPPKTTNPRVPPNVDPIQYFSQSRFLSNLLRNDTHICENVEFQTSGYKNDTNYTYCHVCFDPITFKMLHCYDDMVNINLVDPIEKPSTKSAPLPHESGLVKKSGSKAHSAKSSLSSKKKRKFPKKEEFHGDQPDEEYKAESIGWGEDDLKWISRRNIPVEKVKITVPWYDIQNVYTNSEAYETFREVIRNQWNYEEDREFENFNFIPASLGFEKNETCETKILDTYVRNEDSEKPEENINYLQVVRLFHLNSLYTLAKGPGVKQEFTPVNMKIEKCYKEGHVDIVAVRNRLASQLFELAKKK